MENQDENFRQKEQPSKNIKRIDAHYISHEIQHLLHFEKGFPLTVKELLLRPGKSVREFLFEDRNKYVKPVIFLIVSSIIFTLITHFFHIEYSFFNIDKIVPLKGKIRSKEIGEWTNSHLGYTNLIMGVFIGIWIKIFFKKHHYNIFEIIVLLCFVLGTSLIILATLLATFLSIATFLKNSNIIIIFMFIAIFSNFAYIIWAVGQFFGEKKFINYIKSALTYILGMLTYIITLTIIAYFLKYI